jgi:hypothetical protein
LSCCGHPLFHCLLLDNTKLAHSPFVSHSKESAKMATTPKADTSAAASKALSSANDVNPLPSRSAHSQSSDRGRSDGGGGSDSLAPLSNSRSRSTTPTPSMDSSAHSGSSSGGKGRRLNRGPSALGLDKMIDEKRDAKTMSERVVHIEVCTVKRPVHVSALTCTKKNEHCSLSSLPL